MTVILSGLVISARRSRCELVERLFQSMEIIFEESDMRILRLVMLARCRGGAGFPHLEAHVEALLHVLLLNV